MKYVIDIDKVVRDVHIFLEQKYKFTIRHWDYFYKGKDFWIMADESPEVWTDAPPSEYYSIIKQYKPLEFWSVQKIEHKDATIKWMNKYFDKYKIKFFKDFEHKYKELQKRNVILIDDFPNFPSYEKIILIDTNYNKSTKAKIRIKTPEQLEKYLIKIK